MAISMQKARTLCTQSELGLIKWSSPTQVKTLSPAQLRQKIDRARKLRDKFKDLSRKQAGEARGKRKPTGTRAAKGNERTVEKRELFEEVIARFEKALTKAEAAEAKTKASKAAGKTTKKKTAAKKKVSTKKATAKQATSKKQSSKKKSASKNQSAKSGPSDGLLNAPKLRRRTGVSSLSLGNTGGSSPLTGLGSSLTQQSRETRRQSASKSSKGARVIWCVKVRRSIPNELMQRHTEQHDDDNPTDADPPRSNDRRRLRRHRQAVRLGSDAGPHRLRRALIAHDCLSGPAAVHHPLDRHAGRGVK
jgi:membrane protein involved in colicin uptake